MNLATWIAEYMSYLQSDGHAGRTIVSRFKHLNCLQRFCEARGLARLEDFTSKLTEDFIDYWMQHQPWAKPSAGFKGKPTFRPRHHIAVQYSLHGFFHWAYTTGRLKLDVFAFRAPVRGNYFFPEVEEYLCFCTEHKGLAKNSLIQIELFVRRFDHFLRDRQVRSWSELGVDHIDVFVRQQAARNVKRVQRVHKILRGLFRYLFSLGRVDRDWASALVSPRQYRLARTPRALMAEQVLDLLRSMDRARWGGKRDFAMILTAASLGVRASEIAELKLQDLDWTRAVVSFPPTKGKNVLRLPLSRPLMEALVDYLKNERPNGRSHRNVFLGLTPPFGPLRWSSVSAAIARRMGSAGIKGSGHQLRHAFASELLRGGVAFSTLQELLGHSHLSSTQIYTKIDVTQLREVAVNDAEDM